MISMNAKNAQAHFGEMMISAIKEPVAITKYGKLAAIVISVEEYEKFQKLEDLYWSMKAKIAEEEGYLSRQESDDLLDDILKG